MVDPQAGSAPAPCCVCAAPNGKHCAKCKSRHYCSKACQLVYWKEGGHKEQCKKLATEFSDRLLDELMPVKLKIKDEPPIVEDVAPTAGLKGAARLSAVRETALVKASALNDDSTDWRGTCAICLDLLPVEDDGQTFYECCCKMICTVCSLKCDEYDKRCPLCRSRGHTSDAEWLRRVQKHVDKGEGNAQVELGGAYSDGEMGLKKSFKRAIQMYELAAAQGHAIAQVNLGECYRHDHGVKINHKAAAQWYRRAAEQGHPDAQCSLGAMFYDGEGVAQSFDEAVRWYRLAAAQGWADALSNLGECYKNGHGVPQDLEEAMRLFKRAAAKGDADAAGMVEALAARATG